MKRIRFSLKFILALVFCLASVCAYFAHSAAKRRDAIRALQEIDGFSYQHESSMIPEWLRETVGPEYFPGMENIGATYQKTTDAHLAVLARVPELKSLSTNHAWMGSQVGTMDLTDSSNFDDAPLITDAGLAELEAASHLESLTLFHTAITDEGVSRLRYMRNLRNLAIVSNKITDHAIPELIKINTLQYFSAVGTSISDEGVDKIREALPKCKVIGRVNKEKAEPSVPERV